MRERDFKSAVEKWFRPIADEEWVLSIIFWPKCMREPVRIWKTVCNHEKKKMSKCCVFLNAIFLMISI